MTLPAGARLGPYEILSPLGAGGMGEVYRARDTRLGRDVAVKVLPEAFARDPDRLARFEREARAASALSDPHIVAVYDVGREADVHFFVSELVEGSDLRTRIETGGLAPRKALELAEQIASGLATAHEKGIVHRDLKPENVLITKSGVAKIADFGLAKLTEPAEAGVSELPTSDGHQTSAGLVMGTVSYMSPEQARGAAVDFRSDQFSFGSILYEMITGLHAFKKESAPETLSAIIRDEPRPLAQIVPGSPSPVSWIVERCLAKDPSERFASTRDLARDLASIRHHLSDSGLSPGPIAAPSRRRPGPMRVLAAASVLAAIAGAALLGRRSASRASPSFQRLTFRRGTVTAARFAPDGQTVVYSAQWEGKPGEAFSVRPASRESRALGLSQATLLGVSRSEELAVKLRPRLWSNQLHGTLARAPFGGGAPREVMEDVLDADWSPDGDSLAILRFGPEVRWTVEFPQGKILFEERSAPVTGMRISRDGKRIALSEDAFLAPASVVLLDLAGRKQTLGTGRVTGIAWNGPGDEVWYSQEDSDGASGLWAVKPSGARRLLLRHAGSLVLQDVSRDGTALVSVAHPQMSVMWLPPGAPRESDMAWLDGSAAADISADGRTLLLDEFGSGGGPAGGVYLRKADGSPAVRLSDGLANSLSADGKWVLVQRPDSRSRLVLVPTGAGEPRTVPLPTETGQWWFFPDGRRILLNGAIHSGRTKMYSVDLDGKAYRQIAPDGFDSFFGEMPISPDGKWIDSQTEVPGVNLGKVQLKLFPTEGGEPRTVPGFEPDDVVIRWSGDGKALFVFKRDELPARVFRIDIESGKRTPWLELMPADRAGVTRIPIIVMTPDGKGYAYNLTRDLSDLYLVRGLK